MWHRREEVPHYNGELVLAVFKGDRLESFQMGRAQFVDGTFTVWTNDCLFAYHGAMLPTKFTHWAYFSEYWRLLEELKKETL